MVNNTFVFTIFSGFKFEIKQIILVLWNLKIMNITNNKISMYNENIKQF